MAKLTTQQLIDLKNENKDELQRITQGQAAVGVGIVKRGVKGFVFRARTSLDKVRIQKRLLQLKPNHPLYNVPWQVTVSPNVQPR